MISNKIISTFHVNNLVNQALKYQCPTSFRKFQILKRACFLIYHILYKTFHKFYIIIYCNRAGQFGVRWTCTVWPKKKYFSFWGFRGNTGVCKTAKLTYFWIPNKNRTISDQYFQRFHCRKKIFVIVQYFAQLLYYKYLL